MRNFREYYRECFEAETPKFVRVMKAVPADQGDYRPHPRSTCTADLPDLRQLVGVTENCPNFNVSQTPQPGTDISPPHRPK